MLTVQLSSLDLSSKSISRNYASHKLASKMATSNDQNTAERLESAKDAFNEYLDKAARPEHFLSVNDELGPLRRMDGDRINPTRRKFIGSRYCWNDAEIRWEVIDKSPIVGEDEIWDYLQKVLSETDTRCHKRLSDRLMERVEGLLRQDIRAMLQIWKEYDLDELVLDLEPAVVHNEGEDGQLRSTSLLSYTLLISCGQAPKR